MSNPSSPWFDTVRAEETGSPELRLVIPARNEEKRIERTVADCCRRFGGRARVTVVANDCTDGTAAVVRGLMASYSNLDLVETPLAIGKGGAVRVGLARGREPFVAFLDADGSASAATLEGLLERMRFEGAAGVIGSRWLPTSRIVAAQSLSRRIASRGFNLLVRALFALPFSDTQCGAKVFRREAIGSVLDHLELSNFAFDVDVLVSLRERGYRVIEEPIAWGDAPGTSIRLFPAAFSMALSIVRLRVRRSPLRHWPFTDLLARGTVIPIVPVSTILLLGDGGEVARARLSAIALELGRRGHRTIEPELATFAQRLRFWAWYLARGHAQVHGIVGIAPRSLLARLSTKAKLVLHGDPALDRAKVARLLERLRYRAVFRSVDEIGGAIAAELGP